MFLEESNILLNEGFFSKKKKPEKTPEEKYQDLIEEISEYYEEFLKWYEKPYELGGGYDYLNLEFIYHFNIPLNSLFIKFKKFNKFYNILNIFDKDDLKKIINCFKDKKIYLLLSNDDYILSINSEGKFYEIYWDCGKLNISSYIRPSNLDYKKEDVIKARQYYERNKK